MYAQLGEIVFEGLKGIDSLSLKSEQIIAEHQLIEGKTRLQNAGSKADEVTIAVSIKSSFANPEKEYQALKEYKEQGAVNTLINGRGELLGEYVIKSLELDVKRTTAEGQWVEIEIGIALIENYNSDKQKKAELDAKNAGFAASTKMPTKAATIPVGTDAAAVMQKVNQVSSDAKAADSFLDKARKYGEQANSYMDQAGAKVQQMQSGLTGIQQRIQSSLTLGSSATNLLNQISSINGTCNNLLYSISLHDLQASLGYNTALQSLMSVMSSAAAPVANLVGTQS